MAEATEYLDQKKIQRMASTLLIAANTMLEGAVKDALMGGIGAILEESMKQLPLDKAVFH